MTKGLYIIIILSLIVRTSSGQDTRIWATYYGGPGNEVNPVGGPSVATDVFGNIYLSGYTYSASGISSGGFQDNFGGAVDAFIVKFDASGNRLWASYYGGAGAEYANGIITDVAGNVYLTGKTSSTSGIASEGFQNTFGGGTFDAFIVKFAANGNRLWASYYGGAGDDGGGSVITDSLRNVYLAGQTFTASGLASGGFQNSSGGVSDAFLVKFDSAGNRIWATYYGGESGEDATTVTCDEMGNVYLAGNTASTSGISSGGFQNTLGGAVDAFLVKFDSSGNRIWATYYGGSASELAYGILSNASDVYMTGLTSSLTGISSNGFQNIYGGGTEDAYMVKFDSAGNRIWGTYYGGESYDYCYSSAKDALDNIYLSGDTYSAYGIASGGFQDSLIGIENQFIAKFNSKGNRQCATYFGQNHDEDGHLAVDGSGNIYLAGGTTSISGIASGGFQNTLGGGIDAYLVKFSSCLRDGIAEAGNLNLLSFSPNPSPGKFIIQSSSITIAQIRIFNLLGNLVYTSTIQNRESEIDLSLEPNGIYFIFFKSDNQATTGKLIVYH